jgi:hypothetical protein
MRWWLVVGLILVLGLRWYGENRSEPPDSWTNPPIYPGAQNIKIEPYTDQTLYAGSIPVHSSRRISYTLPYLYATVADWYASRLTAKGWEYTARNRFHPGAYTPLWHYSWGNYGHTQYLMDINVDYAGNGNYHVQIFESTWP